MNNKTILGSLLLIISLNCSVFCQEKALSDYHTQNDIIYSNYEKPNFSSKVSKYAPLALTLYGFMAIESDPLKHVNYEFQEEILEHNPSFRTHLDNYIQFSPLVTTLTLKLSGNSGKNDFKRSLVLFGSSTLIMAGSVYALKNTTKIWRPDGTDRHSFPSGHTATAFAGAELLHQEFKNTYLLWSYSGYVAATATGVLRMYNNKHYFSDVIAGAGIGILSTKAGYWLNEKVFKNKKK